MVSSFEHNSSDITDTGGNSAILELEAGEQVYISIYEKAALYDNDNGHNSFSGFLLFPL